MPMNFSRIFARLSNDMGRVITATTGFDFRILESLFTMAKSGVYHFRCHFATGNAHGERFMFKKKDSSERIDEPSANFFEQLDTL
jgi:hypothetical protein